MGAFFLKHPFQIKISNVQYVEPQDRKKTQMKITRCSKPSNDEVAQLDLGRWLKKKVADYNKISRNNYESKKTRKKKTQAVQTKRIRSKKKKKIKQSHQVKTV